MANTFFRFKQFNINQGESAMKVCTDACLFGAYISEKEKELTSGDTNILDIGTGTGLLSLMLAQKVKAKFDAIEIDKKAYEQAKDNFSNSPWKIRLSIFNADILEFEFRRKYELIISNPPFFENSLQSSDKSKNTAKHTSTLPYNELLRIAFENLLAGGRFYILLPPREFEIFQRIAFNIGLFLRQKLFIRQSKTSNIFRIIGVFSTLESKAISEEEIAIRDDDNYSQPFIALLQDYYLYL